MPIDVLYSYDLVKREVGAKSDGKGVVNKIVNWYGIVYFFAEPPNID